MEFHYLWGSKQLMDKIGGRLKQAVLFFVSTVEKKNNPSRNHKLSTKKREMLGTVNRERMDLKQYL